MAVPEQYVLSKNKCSPNSRFPILVYRNVLPVPLSEDSTTKYLTQNGWRKDGTWGHIAYRHFHPNVHECYGVFAGSSRLLLGQGQGDDEGGITVDVKEGDVIILPAGTSHACLASSEAPEYRYIGVYPENGPKWRTEMGRRSIDGDKLEREIADVLLPEQDPVCGKDGPLNELWR